MISIGSYRSAGKTVVCSKYMDLPPFESDFKNSRCWLRQPMFHSRLAVLLLGVLLVLVSTVAYGVAVPVEVGQVGEQFILYRGGEPYFIKGGGGKKHMGRLAAYGGNSVRTWGAENARRVLDEAHELGLTVTLGLWVRHEGHGFNYDDQEAVAQQLERFRQIILEFRDHPALLMWGIGNEVNLNYRNPRVWDAVEEIARMVHELDGNHPAMTVLAGLPEKDIELIMERASSIDIIGVNVYGGLRKIPQQIRNFGWNGPYVVTEWGNDGYWEVNSTSWGASWEQSSNEKAETYLQRYREVIVKDASRILGAYVFLWGNKTERTPTWFGMFLETGEETSAVDVMRYLWTDSWPENRAPSIAELAIDGIPTSRRDIYLLANNDYQANISITDPDGDPLVLRWEIRPDPQRKAAINDYKDVTEMIEGAIDGSEGILFFNAPADSGAYRLYLFVFDDRNHVATANIPFYIKQDLGLTTNQPPANFPRLSSDLTAVSNLILKDATL